MASIEIKYFCKTTITNIFMSVKNDSKKYDIFHRIILWLRKGTLIK